MKERPILFSGPMVLALLAGTKTQTRRVLKQATGPSLSVGIDDDAPGVAELSWLYGDGPGHEVHEQSKRVACPHGQPGDRLWVRESWAPNTGSAGGFLYRAEHGTAASVNSCDLKTGVWTHSTSRWWPSIHMPRAASRILLEITGVRVERLQDISEADARAEGIEFFNNDQECGCRNYMDKDGRDWTLSPRESFRSLWQSINGPASWDANPWVWVPDFKHIDKSQAAH